MTTVWDYPFSITYIVNIKLSKQISCQWSTLSPYLQIKAGVPQGSILAPLLYSVYKAVILLHPHNTVATFTDDKVILSKNADPVLASFYLQKHLNSLLTWFRKWKAQINTQNSVHVTFTLRRSTCPPSIKLPSPLLEK